MFQAFKSFTKVVALAAPALMLMPAHAEASVIAGPPPYYNPTYEVTSDFNITAIVTAGRGDGSGGSYVVNSFSTSPGTSTIFDPFVETSPLLYSHFTGVTDLIPGTTSIDLSGDLHLVLAVNNFFAASLIGQEFTSIFPDFTESGLINSMLTLTDPKATQTEINDSISMLFNFSDAVYSAGGDFLVTQNEGFSLVAFSDGQSAGTGLSFPTPASAPAGAVPEPMTWLMMLSGFVVLGATLRGSRRLAGREAQAA